MIKNIILGTANFGLNYGIKNKYKKLKIKKIKKILIVLKKKKLNFIETSQDYTNVEKLLGNLNTKQFKIVTKFIFRENNNFVFDKFLETIKNLKTKNIHTVLFHRSSDLLKKNGKTIYDEMLLLKKKGYIKKIGVSSYHKKELKKILDKYKFDVVQVPINIFNQSFIEKDFLHYLKKKKVEIHARSIFLQGLLLLKEKDVPDKFLKDRKTFQKWNLWLKKNRTTNFDACLNFITNQKYIKKIIVGVDNSKQLNEIINFKKSKKKFNFNMMKTKSSRVTDPKLW